MAPKASKARKRAAAERKGHKLTLSKKTLMDLTPGRGKDNAVRGGAGKTANSCYVCTGG